MRRINNPLVRGGSLAAKNAFGSRYTPQKEHQFSPCAHMTLRIISRAELQLGEGHVNRLNSKFVRLRMSTIGTFDHERKDARGAVVEHKVSTGCCILGGEERRACAFLHDIIVLIEYVGDWAGVDPLSLTTSISSRVRLSVVVAFLALSLSPPYIVCWCDRTAQRINASHDSNNR